MQHFKVEHFEEEWPRKKFPKYYSLNNKELSDIQKKLFAQYFLDRNNNLLGLVREIDSIQLTIDKVNAKDDQFCLFKLFSDQNINSTDSVFINWYRYDDIDEIRLSDLDKYFDDIWYPDSDDIDIFDESCSWVLSVRHDGILSLGISTRKTEP